MSVAVTTTCPPGRRRLGVRRAGLVVAAGLVLAAASQTKALINPNYTPVELVHQSEQIWRLEIAPTEKGKAPSVRVAEALKGKAPPGFAVDLARTDQILAGDFRKCLEADGPTTALFFSGRYEGVKDDAMAVAAEGQPDEVALLKIAGLWFGLTRSGRTGPWVLVEDKLDMQSVWAGGADMLRAAVDYIRTDPDPVVPVAVGARWDRAIKAAAIAGKVHGVLPVDLDARGRVSLFVLADSGDRMFRWNAPAGDLTDVTAELKLASKSAAAAWGDFNGDGRTDLASWAGGKLTIWARTAAGTFQPTPADVPTGDVCLGLAALAAAGRPGCRILLSTADVPVLLSPGGSGSWSAAPLVPKDAASFPGAKLGEAGPCLAADFDNDALPDVLQPFAGGALFYRGAPGGAFEPPKSAGRVFAGEKDLRAFTGDYDADGLLDVFVTGRAGCSLWSNRGGGVFRSSIEAAGEVPYISKPNGVGGTACEVNNDGRQDLLICYANMGPQIFFNRGFRCFGYAIEMDMVQSELVPNVGDGQQAGAIADLNGDGAQDLALVLRGGDLWAVLRKGAEDAGPALGVQVVLPPDAPAGPVNVTGWLGKRCQGAWAVRGGPAGPLLGQQMPGPCLLKWCFPGRDPQQKQVDVEAGLMTVVLRPDGAATKVYSGAVPASAATSAAKAAGTTPRGPADTGAPPALQTRPAGPTDAKASPPGEAGKIGTYVAVIAAVLVVVLAAVVALRRRPR